MGSNRSVSDDIRTCIYGSRDAFVFIYRNWILMVGNGLFKPNMTSIISYAYEKHPEKKMELILFIIWV
jgi:dipeptide/tripeptide permease